MATAKQLPSGSWRVRVFAGKDATGKLQYKSFTEPTERKANLAALEWQEKYKEISSDSSNLTVEEAIDAYIELKNNILSPSTIRFLDTVKRNHLQGIKSIKLAHLTRNIIQEAINSEAAGKSPKTVKNVYGVLSSVISQYRPDWSIPKVTLPQQQKPVERALNAKQIAILLNSIDGDPIEIPILLALWLGLRRSEILALKWSDIDFNGMTIRIASALVPDKNSKMVEKSTKTKDSTRTLKLPPYIAEKLKVYPHSGDRIFNISEGLLSKHFPRLCKNIGIGRFKFHDLRRSMATVGLSLNIADKLIMARGGWNNPQTMKNIYQVVLDSDLNEADILINNYFEKLLPNVDK
jgi:integrase